MVGSLTTMHIIVMQAADWRVAALRSGPTTGYVPFKGVRRAHSPDNYEKKGRGYNRGLERERP